MKKKIKIMIIGLIITMLCVSCGNNNSTKQTTPPTGKSDQKTESTPPEQTQAPEPTAEAEKSYVMYAEGKEIATSKMSYGTKLKNYAPSFGYISLGGYYEYLLEGGQKLLLVAPPSVRNAWNVTTIEEAYDVMMKQGVVADLVGGELAIGGDIYGSWDRINLDTEAVTMNGIESMKFDGTVGTTFEFGGKTVSFERYLTGYIFIRPYENGNFPACVIGTISNQVAETAEDVTDVQKEELRHNMKVMMESMEIAPGEEINNYD